MWESDYSREPVDHRLLWIRLLRKVWLIPVAALIGALLVGGGYYLGKVVIGGRTYQAVNMYYADYTGDDVAVNDDFYINYYTWGEISDMDSFVDYMYDALGGALTKEEIRDDTYATIESDVHYVYSYTCTTDPDLTRRLSDAFKEAIVAFGDDSERFDYISAMKSGEVYDNSNVRLGTAFGLGAGIGLVAVVLFMALYAVADTSVYIPSTLERRYHIKTLGAPSMAEFNENCRYMLGSLHNIACIPAEPGSAAGIDLGGTKATAYPNPVAQPEALESIRNCDGVVITVRAGRHNGKQLERTLEELARQDINVTALCLTGEDSKLIKAYYRA